MYQPFEIVSANELKRSILANEQVISFFNLCGFFCCTEGEVCFLSNSEEYVLHKNDVYIYMPATHVRLKSYSDDVDGYFAQADVSYVLPYANTIIDMGTLFNIRRNPLFALTSEQVDSLVHKMVELRRRTEETSAAHYSDERRNLLAQLIQSMAQIIFYEILFDYFGKFDLNVAAPTHNEIVMQRFLTSLSHNYMNERDVAFYANEQNIAPRYFATIVKKVSGLTPLELIVRMVISEAKLLLLRTNASIKEIAVSMNFSSQTFFGKYFKQYVGLSPKEFRQRNRLN